jgi:Winged helix-turn helix
MAVVSQSMRRKLSLLQLATELQNVSKACRLMGYHRDTFYEVRRAFQTGGVAALVEQRRGPRGPHPNRVAPEIEEQIRAYALEHPTHGAPRVANQLRLAGVTVSAGGVRGVWLRHDLETRLKRLLRLERHAQETTFVLSGERLRLLERHSVDFRCRQGMGIADLPRSPTLPALAIGPVVPSLDRMPSECIMICICAPH